MINRRKDVYVISRLVDFPGGCDEGEAGRFLKKGAALQLHRINESYLKK
jgi:hypothetical protein